MLDIDGDMSTIFISYDRNSQDLVESLAEDISGFGNTVWMDRQLSGGQSWWAQILENIQKCDVFVFALSPASLESIACIREYEYANALGKSILPVLVKDGVSINLLPEALSKIHYVDFRNPNEKATTLSVGRALKTAEISGPLPDPLPPPPEVPLSNLSRISHQIAAISLSGDEQSTLLMNLKEFLEDSESMHDVVALLRRLRNRKDLLSDLRDEVDSIISDCQVREATSESAENLTPGESQKPVLVSRTYSGFRLLDYFVLALFIATLLSVFTAINPAQNTKYNARYNASTETGYYFSIPETFENSSWYEQYDAFFDESEDLAYILQPLISTPFPNQRLLRGAVVNALLESPDRSISDTQFDGLVDMIVANSSYLPDVETTQKITRTEYDFSWNFPGCGCEINPGYSLYGFFPSWLLSPDNLQGQQTVELKYFDRIAYFGLSIDINGEVNEDDLWAENGLLSDFIVQAHTRATHVDLVAYSSEWEGWDETAIQNAISNLLFKLDIPLNFPASQRVAMIFSPIGPTVSETIGRDTMGDGITLFFDDLVSESTGDVKDLAIILQFLEKLKAALPSGEELPVNLLLNVKTEAVPAVFAQLGPMLKSTDISPAALIERTFIFLEQDTVTNSENLRAEIVETFGAVEALEVLPTIQPVLIPLRSRDGSYDSFYDELRLNQELFGVSGGTAIWPIPVQPNRAGDAVVENGSLILESVLEEFAADGPDEEQKNWRITYRTLYFPHRIFLTFILTLVFVEFIILELISKIWPVSRKLLYVSRALGCLSFVITFFLVAFIDPFISSWRILFFLSVPVFYYLLKLIFRYMSDFRDKDNWTKISKGSE